MSEDRGEMTTFLLEGERQGIYAWEGKLRLRGRGTCLPFLCLPSPEVRQVLPGSCTGCFIRSFLLLTPGKRPWRVRQFVSQVSRSHTPSRLRSHCCPSKCEEGALEGLSKLWRRLLAATTTPTHQGHRLQDQHQP